MTGNFKLLKKATFEHRGDTLEAKLRDTSGNYYYKGSALINHRKQILKLIKELKEKGVSFPSEGWFD